MKKIYTKEEKQKILNDVSILGMNGTARKYNIQRCVLYGWKYPEKIKERLEKNKEKNNENERRRYWLNRGKILLIKAEKAKKRYEKNKEKFIEKQKNYYLINKKEINDKKRKKYIEDIEYRNCVLEKNKKYIEKNKELLKQKKKDYYFLNKDRFKEQRKKVHTRYCNKKYKESTNYVDIIKNNINKKQELLNKLETIDINNKILIDKDFWDDLKAFCLKDEIKTILIKIIRNNNIELPFKKYTEKEAINSFNNLIDLKMEEIIKSGEWVSKFNYQNNLLNKYIDLSIKGNISSNYFHQEDRLKCSSYYDPSPYDVWNSNKYLGQCLNYLWKINGDITLATIRKGLELRKYVSAQFRPSTAKVLYDMFNSKKKY